MIRSHWEDHEYCQDGEDDESDRDRTSANMTHAPQSASGASLEGLGGTSTHRHNLRPAKAAYRESGNQ